LSRRLDPDELAPIAFRPEQRSTQPMSSAFDGLSPAQPSWSLTSIQSERPTAQQVLQPVASLLGTTAQSLVDQMQSGATLSGIATQQGISQNGLINAIEQGLQSTNPQTSAIAQNYSPSSIATLAANIANGTARVGGHLHQHQHDGVQPASTMSAAVGTGTVTSLAAILDVDPETLRQALSLQSMLSSGLQADTTA
jgi:hypothetical protein